MDFGFPKTPRHVTETDPHYAESLRHAYLAMIAEHTTGVVAMPPEFTLTWSKKGRPLTLSLKIALIDDVTETVVHDPSDTVEVQGAKLASVSRMARIILRGRTPSGQDRVSYRQTITSLRDVICPVLLRRALVHHRFGIDRLDDAYDARSKTKTDFSFEYKPRGRSSTLLPNRAGDTMQDLLVSGRVKQHGPELEIVHLTIADGVVYKYASGSAVRHSLTVADEWPATTRSAIGGRRLEDIVTHPMFDGCGHIVDEVDLWNRKTRLILSPSYDTVKGF